MQRASWGTLAVLGYILSPLSWWNDLWVNIPLAYAAASLAQFLNPKFFLPVFVGAYWVTNLLGLILMHAGIRGAATEKVPGLTRAGAFWWLTISLGYTIAIALLVHWNILRPLETYIHLAAPP